MIDNLNRVRGPFNLSDVQLAAAEAAVRDQDWVAARRADNTRLRAWLAGELGSLGIPSDPSQANFILFRPRSVPGATVWQRLVDRSVLVRDCSSWPRLEGCLRVTIGRPDENDRFIRALDQALDQETPQP